jgi:Ca-activated chloride channel family protein
VNRRGAIVNGLRPDAFRIFEDKTPQEIFSFTEQDVPASIGVVLDISGSMKGTLDQAQLALRSFLDTANPEDEAFLYTVSSIRFHRAQTETPDLLRTWRYSPAAFCLLKPRAARL